MIKIFVDDMRVPLDHGWILASTVEEAKKIIAVADEFIISLDYDLGESEGYELTTRPLVAWMAEKGYRPQAAAVHSSNPVGSAWIKQALDKDFETPVPTIPIPRWGI